MATGIRDAEASDRKLDRRMTVWQLFFISMGGIIGSGWLFASLAAASIAGPAAIVSWIIGGVLVLLVALNYAEVAGMLPRSGAIVRYPHMTHGGYTGFILGWTYLLSAVSVPAIEAEAVVTYASTYINGIIDPKTSELTWPAGILFGIGLMVLFFIINYVGIKFLSQFNSFVTGWKFLIPGITVILLLVLDLHTKNFGGYAGGFAPLGWSPVLSAVATSGIVFSYLGFRQALDFGGEARNPQRDVPIATIASVLAGMAIYVLLQVAFIGAIKWGAFGIHAGDWSLLKAAGSAAKDAPFYVALKAAGPALLGGFATVLLIDAFVSPTGTGYIYLGTSARTVYGLSVVGYLPKMFQSIVARFRIPWIALIASTVVGCLFFLPLPSWYELVGIITSATVLTYIMGGIGVHVLRRTAGSLYRPFRLPAADLIGPAGFVGALMIVYWSGFPTLAIVFAAVFIALPIFVWFYAPNKGWINPVSGGLLGLVFTILWIIVQRWGQWALVAVPTAVPHPAFPVFYFTIILLVCGFTGALYYLCNEEGRKAVGSTWWLIYFLLAIFGISYYGAYGPLKTPGIPFPGDLLVVIMVGLTAYGWAIRSGYETEDIQAIVASGSGLVGGEPSESPVTPPASAPPGFGH
ncbi:MAG TPA: APC family permease [Candidatus Micrarchaeaceae archaeon]|nr:APC family permease [Candidatus Micrarchaeaceae archaeon]